jgi:hypothetical protein
MTAYLPTGDFADRVMKARHESQCPKCMATILPTMRIAQVRGQWIHVGCLVSRQAMIAPSCT